MAKQTWNNPIDKNTDWGGDASTGNLPVSGAMVQRFIKETLNGKAGVFYYDSANNRYLVFADNEARDTYLADPTQTSLILGTFDAPFNYSAEITLSSPAYNAVFLNSTGNYLDFTFDVKNKQGASTGENVTITYTFIRNATKKVVSEMKKSGEAVHFNVDKYLGEGTNTIIIGVTGQTSLAATTVSVTYQVVNLQLTDGMDISKVYNLSNGAQTMEIPFSISGYGTKVVEWYIDGERLPFVKTDDEIVDAQTQRTKRISISNLQQGRHSLQIRAYTTVNGEEFYTDTLYRDFLVYTATDSKTILGVAITIPKAHGVLGASDSVTLYDMVQYVPYTLRFASYTPSNAISTEVSVILNEEVKAVIGSANSRENEVQLVSSKSGNASVVLRCADAEYIIPAVIQKTNTTLQEIETDLALDFNANGKTNYSADRDQWSYKGIKGTFRGFNWNDTSGWVDGRLEINNGASFSIDYAPLAGTPTRNGKTIEIEWSTKNVSDDDAVICDMRENGVGILITATKVHMRSADGVVVETEYKSDENVRVGFVINRSSGSTNQRLSFIYANGILSRGDKWSANDSYQSDAVLQFAGSEGAEVSLRAIRVYDNALSSDQMLNNYILYRDSVSDMMDVYGRNDVYEQGTTTFSPDKMVNRLPVMIVTGDIPILENTSDKDTQIIVDIEYRNQQKPEKSFTMKNAAMRPQGTSSMGYPKKNFRIYTQKVDGTILYDANGNVVEDKLYSFTDTAQPVNCWCLKADYAESSGTHNTGIARLWNDALKNVQVNGEYVCRTEAQKKALEVGYKYDVRTTIDGFPILLFYRPSANDDVIFIGKYNFNNDKSTESVFGFEGIPSFNNEKMQCWEVLNNGNALALFTSTEGFDENWAEAFESRYPDTKTPYTGDLKAFCEWMTNVSEADFSTQKWEHLNVYMMAAYWCYLMRHAAADQFVKNAMFTTEDGQHFYYILYDNDTINGLINTGHLRIKPTDTRQTVDDSGAYVFAGHDSRLWNMLEADDEFMRIVSDVDNGLYSAGISYANTIKIFDEEQADKWVEAVYNQDAQYKYVGPYTDKGIDNLFMMQGKRDLHRKWWLAKRFSIYDAKYVSGTYKSQAVEIKCLNGTAAGQKFTVTAGAPLDYGFGINNVPREYGVTLEVGESHEFTTSEVVNIGDPIRIYGAPNIASIDFSKMSSRLAVITIANVYDEALGTKLTRLVLGKAGVSNQEVAEISGLKQAMALEYLDVTGFKKLTSLDLTAQTNLKSLIATASGATSFTFAKGAPLEVLALPSGVRSLELSQLPYLHADGISFEALSSLEMISITACPNVTNDFGFIYDWYKSKSIADSRATLVLDNVDWTDVDADKLIEISKIGNLSLKGRIYLKSISLEQMNRLMEVFGETAFNENAELFIDGPDAIFILGNTDILEGSVQKYKTVIFGGSATSIQYSLYNGSNSYTSVAKDGTVTILEGFGNGRFTLRAIVSKGSETFYEDIVINVTKRTYPTKDNLTIKGNPKIEIDYQVYTLEYPADVNGDFATSWSLASNLGGYVEIQASDDNGCALRRLKDTYLPVYLTLTATLTKRVNGAAVATVSKEIVYINEAVAETDAGIVAALYAAGLCSSDKFITKDEAAKVTASDLQKGTSESTSIFWNYRNQVKTFDGFQFFTGLTEVPDHCFSQSKLESIVLNDKITKIGKNAFNLNYWLKHINMPKSLIALGENALGATIIETIDLPEGLMTLGTKCLWECDYLEEVTVPSTVAEIPTYFCYLSGVKRVVLKEGVQTIAANAFQECLYLESLTIPSTVTTISDIFNKCDKVQFNVSESNPNFKSIDGVLYDKDLTRLLLFRSGAVAKECNIPSSVSQISNYGFYQTAIEVVNHASGVNVGTDSFGYCTNLRRLNFKVLSCDAGTSPFAECKSLEAITFASSVNRLANNCLIGCTSLKTIISEAENAPATGYYTFGHTIGKWVGENTKSTGENFLYLPIVATGYETGGWLDPLQNASKCGFSIYGKLTISSNRSNAQFSVTYTTVGGLMKTVTVGVGTCYLNDVKYGASITIAPITTGVGEWDWTSKTFIYSKENNAVENNAYVFPANATIEGDANPVKNNTYTWSTTILDVDGAYTAEWSLSGEITSQVEIASQDNTKCVMRIIGVPTEFYYGTLTLTLRKVDGTLLATATKSLAAVIEDVIVTTKSNEGLQAPLYHYGLVANETYSLKSEIEKISAGQLFYGSSASDYNAFYKYANTGYNKPRLNSFDEFEYFTGVKSLPNFALFSLPISSVKLPNTIRSIGRQGISNLGSLKSLVIPESVTTFSEKAIIMNNGLKSITSYAKASSLPENCFADNPYLESINIPARVTSIGTMAFGECPMLREIICSPKTAPTCARTVFGYSSTSAVSPKYLRVPFGATGYEEGVWKSELLDKGFIIYGRVKISSNKENAKFNISYTTSEGTIKTVYVGVGSTYLNDIKYDTQMTITPAAISGYTWSEPSKTFVYNDSTQGHEFNAYIYPSAMSIDGTGSLVGGNSETYRAVLTPSNFDVPVTYTWSVSGSSNVSITPNGSECVVNSNHVEADENFTLSCIMKTNDNKVTLQKTRNVQLATRPNFITATYDVPSANSTLKVFFNTTIVKQMTYMEVDGVEVTPSQTALFTAAGLRKVRFSVQGSISMLFYSVDKLVSVDFSECNGALITNMDLAFQSSSLTSITFGECTFPNMKTLAQAFSRCKNLSEIDMRPFDGAPITSFYETFNDCTSLTSVIWGSASFPNATEFYAMFANCTSLGEINWSASTFPSATNLNNTFKGCNSLSIIDMVPFEGAPINNVNGAFNGCSNLIYIEWGNCHFPNVIGLQETYKQCKMASISLQPFNGATIGALNMTFESCRQLQTIDWGNCNLKTVDTLYRTFYDCQSLTSVDLTGLTGVTNLSNAFNECLALKTITCPWNSAPSTSNAFGTSTNTYTGRNSYNTGANILYVPSGATGYDGGEWADPLRNADKCGFTLSATL